MPGIVRAYLCSRYDVVERAIVPDEIGTFDECFITNSLMGIMAVRQFGENAFPVSEKRRQLPSFNAMYRIGSAPFRDPYKVSSWKALPSISFQVKV